MIQPLVPLQEELERRAEAQAARAESVAELQSRTIAEESLEEARRREDEARHKGRAMADDEASRRLLMARRAAFRLVLTERRSAIDALRRACLQAVIELRAEPGYAEIEEELTEIATERLGLDSVIERDPAGLGGIRAVNGSHMVDLTLPALVDRSIDELGPTVEELWA